jgi:hypothetical protein
MVYPFVNEELNKISTWDDSGVLYHRVIFAKKDDVITKAISTRFKGGYTAVRFYPNDSEGFSMNLQEVTLTVELLQGALAEGALKQPPDETDGCIAEPKTKRFDEGDGKLNFELILRSLSDGKVCEAIYAVVIDGAALIQFHFEDWEEYNLTRSELVQMHDFFKRLLEALRLT